MITTSIGDDISTLASQRRSRYSPLMNLQFTAIIESCEEGGYWGRLLEFPPVMTQGESIEEVERNLVTCLSEFIDITREEAEEHKKRGTLVRSLVLDS